MSTDNAVSLAAYDDYCEARKRAPFDGALSPSSPEIVALPIHDDDAIHSTDPEECLGTVADARAPTEDAFKPNGLWYGLGRSWFEWTESEHFHEWIGHVYRLHLDRSAMLLLRTVGDLDAFTERYRSADWRGRYTINWRAVALAYDGIEIAPYQWERRMELSWYYSWDVASGCIWRANAVKEVEVLL